MNAVHKSYMFSGSTRFVDYLKYEFCWGVGRIYRLAWMRVVH